MSIQIQSALDSLKRQSLKVILENIYLRSASMKNVIDDYIQSGKAIFEDLMHFSNYEGTSFSSDFINANMLLAYMDFYALYTITYSNYYVFESLKNISNSKFNYINNLYKDSYAILSEKKFSTDYRYIRYCNFAIPKDIDVAKSRTNIRGKVVSDMLNIDGVLTLPAITSTTSKPSFISFSYTDGSNHISEEDVGDDYLYLSILRSHSEKLGMLKLSDPNYIVHKYDGDALNETGYTELPTITGTVYGHFSKEIHVTITAITYKIDSELIETIWLQGSTNGHDWSSPFSCTPNVSTKIFIERDITIGINIILQENKHAAIGDRWTIKLIDISMPDPELQIRFGFGALNKISYIKYNEVSPYKLNIVDNSVKIKKLKFDSAKISSGIYDNRMTHFILSEGPASSVDISFTQSNHDISSRNGSLYHKHSFMVNDIVGVTSEYKQHGGISLKAIEVKDIGSIGVVANQYIPLSTEEHSIENPIPETVFVEYNAYVQNGTGRVCIPVIERSYLKKSMTSISIPNFRLLDHEPINADMVGVRDGGILYSTTSKRYWTIMSGKIIYNPEFSLIKRGEIVKSIFDNITYTMCEDGVLRKLTDSISNYIPLLFEYALPEKIETYDSLSEVGLVICKQRFPVDTKYALFGKYGYMKAYNIHTGEEADASYDKDSNSTTIYNYRLRSGYCLWYAFKINSMIETIKNDLSSGNWIYAGADIYYMYYLDEKDDIHTAIRVREKNTNLLSPFTGTIEASIELRSLGKPNITPFIFDYTLLCT